METRRLLDVARDEVADVTGRRVETVSGLRRDGDDGWEVTVEVLEMQRVPSTMDLLATYAVTLSEDGDVLGFERRRRYHRASVDQNGSRA
jgi:Gas vesicle synthesis protein GvpO